MNADAMPRTVEVRIARTARASARADLRMDEQSHNRYRMVSGTKNLLPQSSLSVSDSRGAVRQTGREWNRRFRSRPEGDPHALLRAAARRARHAAEPRGTGRRNGRIPGVPR